MSLFSVEEICAGCKHTTFVTCQVCPDEHMCRCDVDALSEVSVIHGSCPKKAPSLPEKPAPEEVRR